MWTVDKAWKDDVRALMKRNEISQADLARTLGVSPASLTFLFKPDTKQSRLVPAIHKALGLPTPAITTPHASGTPAPASRSPHRSRIRAA